MTTLEPAAAAGVQKKPANRLMQQDFSWYPG
jgi:hypothetical protein